MAGFLAPLLAFAGSAMNMFQQNETNNLNRELLDQQYDRQKELLQMQNDWNSPINQKRLYEKAGINPAWLFGGMSGLDSTMSAPNAPNAPNMVAPQVDWSSPAQLFLDQMRVQNETMQTEQSIKESIQKTESYKIANDNAQRKYDAEIAKLEAEKGLTDEERKLREQQIKTEYERTKEVIQSVETMRYNQELLKQRAITEGWSQRKMAKEIDRLVKITPLEAKEIQSRTNLNHQQALVAAETIGKVKAEVVNLVKQGKSIDFDNFSKMLDNNLKEVTTKNQLSLEELKGSSDWMNLFYQETDGFVGSIAKTLAALSQGWDASFGYGARHERANNRINDGTYWLFNE